MALPKTSVLQNLQASYEAYSQILLLVTTVIASPTQANIDAAVRATMLGTDRAQVLQPKPTYSLDGENYDWAGYQATVLAQLQGLKALMQREGGPYLIRSRWRA